MLPEVDMVIIPRQELVPRTFFGRTREDIIVVNWSEMLSVLSDFRKETTAVTFHRLDYASRPKNIESFIRKHKPAAPMPKAIPWDHVLDREIVERNR
jgi:hypothetical protein